MSIEKKMNLDRIEKRKVCYHCIHFKRSKHLIVKGFCGRISGRSAIRQRQDMKMNVSTNVNDSCRFFEKNIRKNSF
jgi:hypothetical protein